MHLVSLLPAVANQCPHPYGIAFTGVLGVMGVGTSLLDCFSTVESSLQFIQKQIGVYKPTSKHSERRDGANFNEVLGSVKFVVQVLSKAVTESRVTT